MADLDYQVRDRSLLLPWYKKYVVEPAVAWFPRSLHPNTITHAGHLLNLAGLLVVLAVGSPSGGAAYAVAAVLLQAYNFCDNADGAHARRTGQSSALGELLDHGLDLLNVAYISALAALTIGASPLVTALLVTAITGAAAITYWEQAETGVFQLGLLNQVEATLTLSFSLLVAARFGPQVFGAHLGPVAVRDLIAAVVVVGAVAGMLGAGRRVARRGGALLPLATQVLFGAAVALATAAGALDPVVGAVAGATGYVFLGVRNLTLRMAGRKPLLETGVLVLALVLMAEAVTSMTGRSAGALATNLTAALGTGCLVLLVLVHARRGLRMVSGKRAG